MLQPAVSREGILILDRIRKGIAARESRRSLSLILAMGRDYAMGIATARDSSSVLYL
jgi:hypothetical protein